MPISTKDHQQSLTLGGDDEERMQPTAKRSKHLVVLPWNWKFKHTIPRTRADCPPPPEPGGPRLCPHFRCENNTWARAGIDREGRRVEWSEQHGIYIDGWKLPPDDIVMHHPDNCVQDWLDRNNGQPLEPKQIAECLGLTTRQIRRIAVAAKRKALEAEGGEELMRDKVER
jgi:hypothetical protein